MKRILTILLICITCCSSILGKEKGTNKGSFIKWNNAIGLGIGYTNLYKGFSSQYEGISAPSSLIHFDITLHGVYIGFDGIGKGTGYDVYGYSEKLSTYALKLGPSLRVGKSNKWEYTINPYAGVVFYTLSDSSENDIGARDEYGVKESKFIGGCRLSAIYDWYYLSAHLSNREFGFSIGIEFEM